MAEPSIEVTPPCHCGCGYRCGGPGKCPVFEKDMQKCLSEHYVQDCDHDWSGPEVEGERFSSVTCCHCGMTAIGHDMFTGP